MTDFDITDDTDDSTDGDSDDAVDINLVTTDGDEPAPFTRQHGDWTVPATRIVATITFTCGGVIAPHAHHHRDTLEGLIEDRAVDHDAGEVDVPEAYAAARHIERKPDVGNVSLKFVHAPEFEIECTIDV